MKKLDDLETGLSRLFLEAIEEALQELLESGFELPLYIIAISANGSMVFAEYAKGSARAGEGMEIDALSSRDRPEGYVLPINIIFVDSKGEAARLFIQAPDKYKLSSFGGQGVETSGRPNSRPSPLPFPMNQGEREKIKMVEEIKETKCPKCGENLIWMYYCDLCGWHNKDEIERIRQTYKKGISWGDLIKHLIIEAKAGRKLLAAGVPAARFFFILEDMSKEGEIEKILEEIRGREKNLFIKDDQLIEEGVETVTERLLKKISI